MAIPTIDKTGLSHTLRVTTVTLSIGSKALTLCEEAKTATVSLECLR
jgi:hypothetical protein